MRLIIRGREHPTEYYIVYASATSAEECTDLEESKAVLARFKADVARLGMNLDEKPQLVEFSDAGLEAIGVHHCRGIGCGPRGGQGTLRQAWNRH